MDQETIHEFLENAPDAVEMKKRQEQKISKAEATSKKREEYKAELNKMTDDIISQKENRKTEADIAFTKAVAQKKEAIISARPFHEQEATRKALARLPEEISRFEFQKGRYAKEVSAGLIRVVEDEAVNNSSNGNPIRSVTRQGYEANKEYWGPLVRDGLARIIDIMDVGK